MNIDRDGARRDRDIYRLAAEVEPTKAELAKRRP